MGTVFPIVVVIHYTLNQCRRLVSTEEIDQTHNSIEIQMAVILY